MDESDILGGPLIVKPDTSFLSTILSSRWYTLVAVFLGLGAFALTRLGWYRLKKWQESGYKKAARRRHGIPDEDNRPFAVAYAAAQRAKEGKAKPQRNTLQRRVLQSSTGTSTPISTHNASTAWTTSHTHQVYNSSSYQPSPSTYSRTQSAQPDQQYYDQHQHQQHQLTLQPDHPASSSLAPEPAPQFISARKRRAEADEEDTAKKTRVEGEELIDGNEDAGFDLPILKRGAKRELDEGNLRTPRDKRARNFSRDHTPEDFVMADDEGNAEEGAGEEDEEMSDLHTFISRGKKRDRTAAGSTFGGDEEEGTVGHDKSRRKHKRSSDIGLPPRKERLPPLSKDPLCKGRRIGDEWEANGVQYKVGPAPEGARMRQTMVKQARSKFIMPKDSEHPDSQAHLEVFVEKWLTEEEYKSAKDNYELAWQDTPSQSVEPEDEENGYDDVQDFTPIKTGKNLLWSSPSKNISGPLPSSKRGPFRQSVATNLGMRINPFQTPTAPSSTATTSAMPSTPTGKPMLQPSSRPMGRRIASAKPIHIPLPTPIDNGSAPGLYRSFSKWEKQDLEAEAMAKMRERMSPAKPSASASTSFVPPAAKVAPTPPLFPSSATFPAPATAPAAPASFLAAPAATTAPAPAPAKTLSFAFPSAPASAPVKEAAPAPTPPAAAVPSFFAPSKPAPAPEAAPPKPAEAPKPQAAAAPEPPKPAASSIPKFFNVDTPAAPTPPAAVPSSGFFAPVDPAVASKPAASFSFGPTPVAKPAESAKPASFVFTQTATPVKATSAGGFGFAAPTKPAEVPASSGGSAPAPAASSGAFSFGPKKDITSEPKPANDAPAPAKFSFGGVKPVAPAAGFGNGASAFGGGDEGKSSAFGVGGGKGSTSAFGGNASAFGGGGGDQQVKAPASSSTFGTTSAFGNSATAPTPSAFGGGDQAKPSPFGGPSSGSAFGSESSFGTTLSAAAPAQSAFGGQTNKAVTPFGASSPSVFGAKSAFGTAPSSTSTTTTNTTTTTTPSTFGFGAPSNGTTSAFGASADAPKSAFGGGGAFSGAGSGAFGSSSTTPAAAAPAPAKFSFGASSTSSGSSTPTFGSTSAFGAPAASGTVTPAAPVFGAPASTNGTAATPSSFGFGGAKTGPTNSTFSFGK